MTSITEFQNGEDLGGSMIKFKVGKVYTTGPVGDSKLIFDCKVLKVTRQFIKIEIDNEIVTVKLYSKDGVEFCYPLGIYKTSGVFSVIPVMRANEEKV